MSLTLDPQTEQRIQQETLRGRYRNPSLLINIALDALAASAWTDEEKPELDGHLDQSEADAKAGRVYPAEEPARLLDQRTAARSKGGKTAAQFLADRAARANGKGLMHYLENAPDVAE